MLGEKIKDLRSKCNMTQKDLADKLFVSSQAVSRWENGEVEPSISTIKEMAVIFGVSINELLETDEFTPEKEVVVEKEIVYKDAPKPVLALCEKCNKPLYEQEEIHRYSYSTHTRHGKRSVSGSKSMILCEECENKRLEEKEKARRANILKRRKWGFFTSSVVLTLFIVLAVLKFIDGDNTLGGLFIAIAITGAEFAGVIIMNNTFVTEVWVEVATWSVHLPGVIFSWDLDGLAALVAFKIVAGIISFALTVFVILLATAIGCFLSIFAYPSSLIRSFNYEDYDN